MEDDGSVTYPLDKCVCACVCVHACTFSSLKFAYQITPDAQTSVCVMATNLICWRSQYHSGYKQQFRDISFCVCYTHWCLNYDKKAGTASQVSPESTSLISHVHTASQPRSNF